MFEKKKAQGLDNKKPKFTTFGNDSDDEQEVTDEIPNVEDIMKSLDGEIKSSKQREKNATIAQVYSTTKGKQQTKTKNVNACGCFGS